MQNSCCNHKNIESTDNAVLKLLLLTLNDNLVQLLIFDTRYAIIRLVMQSDPCCNLCTEIGGLQEFYSKCNNA